MYDVIIIGGGPAGMTAGIYAARFKLNALIISKETGGYMTESPQIENYPGFKSISGLELAGIMKEQVKSLGVEILEDEEVIEVKKIKEFSVKTKTNKSFKGKAIIIALGTARRKLDVKGEDEFAGKGVSYCATCDAAFFRNKDVAVVGGANSAVVSAILLSKFAKNVTILYRKKPLRADPFWIDKMNKIKNIKVECCVNVTEIKGTKMVESITLDNGKEKKVQGVFVEIGSMPVISLAKSLGVETNPEGYIIVDKTQKTNIEGVYAAGDITTGSNQLRQIITACAEGAVAASSIHDILK